jgi:hypothetical protein
MDAKRMEMTIARSWTRVDYSIATGVARVACTTRRWVSVLALLACAVGMGRAETCTTQSGLAEADRNAIATAALAVGTKFQANDAAFLRANSVGEVQKDFGALQYLTSVTAPKLAGDTPSVVQVYLLDATTLKANADGSAADAQFFCSLNRTTMEADFLIPALPAGKYAFAMVDFTAAGATTPVWRLSLLLRQDQGKWLLAGVYPKALTAAGHDGLWYWTQARQYAKDKQPWNAWLYYQAASMLLRPTDFVVSTHLDKLRSEQSSAAPPALSDGVSADAPLVVKGADGTDYHFTGLTVDDSQGQPALDIVAHLHADALTDPVAARKRNADAMAALLKAYPELRKPFHGVWMYAEATGAQPFATEEPMSEIK